jgi:hypothetical protein
LNDRSTAEGRRCGEKARTAETGRVLPIATVQDSGCSCHLHQAVTDQEEMLEHAIYMVDNRSSLREHDAIMKTRTTRDAGYDARA